MRVSFCFNADSYQRAGVTGRKGNIRKVTAEKMPSRNCILNALDIQGRAYVNACRFCGNNTADKKPVTKAQCYEIRTILNSASVPDKRIKDLVDFLRTEDDYYFLRALISNCKFQENEQDVNRDILSVLNKCNFEFAKKMYGDKSLLKKDIANILQYTNEENIELAEILCFDKELNFPKNRIGFTINSVDSENIEFVKRLYSNKDASWDNAIVDYSDGDNLELAEILCFDKELNFPKDKISSILDSVERDDIDKCLHIIEDYKRGKVTYSALFPLLNLDIEPDDIENIRHVMGKEKADALCSSELTIVCRLFGLYKKQNVDEISMPLRKKMLQGLTLCNADLFSVSNKLKEDFPLIPSNQEEYCKLLSALVQLNGIKTKELNDKEIDDINLSISQLSILISSMPDDKFKDIQIIQPYSKNEFIRDVIKITNNLSEKERQKLCNYFGFELCPDKDGVSGFSVFGYPVNSSDDNIQNKLNNKKQKEAFKALEAKVTEFLEANPVVCKSLSGEDSGKIKLIEQEINKIIRFFPELRMQIGEFSDSDDMHDIFKHNLCVMRKIVLNSEFNTLKDSDKKLLLKTSLLYKCTMQKNKQQDYYSSDDAFDAYYILKRLKPTKDEEYKLYTLIKNQNRMNYVFDAECDKDIIKRMHSVAFDMEYDNLFRLFQILAEADMEELNTNNVSNKYKKFKKYSKEIQSYINELKKTQPLLPVTAVPKASVINKAITKVNDDYSTNIKGVYKDENGLIIIKFNEVEDWEKIGFKKGVSTGGIKAKGFEKNGRKVKGYEIETGNIKFYAHGLDNPMQLGKFSSFVLPDSEALLCASYAERPESKYRFFRTQGVILNAGIQHCYSLIDSDGISGHIKNTDNFKKNYVFGGKREEDRLYISNLIKEALNFNDEEYIKFIEQNANKEFQEIEPESIRLKLIQAFAGINSEVRSGGRAFNEVKISNPEVMAVYSYPAGDDVGNVKDFMEKTKEKTFDSKSGLTQNSNTFLRKYALENDIPFIIFGD